MFAESYTKTGGWAVDLEDRDQLYKTAKPIEYTRPSYPEPDDFSPGEWLPIENQGNQGACQGHMLSTGVEQLMVRAGCPHVQLSRAQAYYETQRIDGIQGDRGSTIEGGCRLAEGDGLVEESVWPYPNGYNPSRPSGYAQAKRYKIKGHAKVESFEDAIEHVWLEGPILLGIIWSRDIDEQVRRNKGVVRSYSTSARGGGHAICGVGKRKNHWDGSPLGETMLEIFNSWDVNWGYRGKFLVPKAPFENMLRHRFNVIVKAYGLEEPEVPNLDIPTL